MSQEKDVCSGGIVSKDQSSFTFTNHHNTSCYVSFSTTPPGANQSYTVPAKVGPTPGTTTVNYTSGITGTYSYAKPACCGAGEDNPSIKMQ